MKKDYVYLLVTADKFELPLMVAETFAELTEMTGLQYTTLRSALIRNSVIDGRYRIIKVDTREPEERFTKSDFVEYCREKNLEETDFDSFKAFMEFCFNS
ncbi:MAG: hypothetical protein E7351_01535 [Clostridiales bacterium]|nr:hypothetical protein [Clostridiales bacterium]